MSNLALRMAAYALKTYHTRDPFEIISQRKINLDFMQSLDALLGFYAVVNNRRFIRINAGASDQDQLQVAGHELGHDFLHFDAARQQTALKDTWFYSTSSSKQEREANLFSAELIIPDENILDPLGYRQYMDYMLLHKSQTEKGPEWLIEVSMDFQATHDFMSLEELSREMGLDVHLLEFKLAALKHKGYKMPYIPELQSDYLKR